MGPISFFLNSSYAPAPYAFKPSAYLIFQRPSEFLSGTTLTSTFIASIQGVHVEIPWVFTLSLVIDSCKM